MRRCLKILFKKSFQEVRGACAEGAREKVSEVGACMPWDHQDDLGGTVSGTIKKKTLSMMLSLKTVLEIRKYGDKEIRFSKVFSGKRQFVRLS